MKQMYLNRINAQERFENGPKTVRVKSRIGSRLVRKSLDSFLTRFCLISLFLILIGGFSTEVWAQLPYNKTMTSSHYSNSKIVVSKVAEDNHYEWNDNGIRLGYYTSRYPFVGTVQAPGNWDDKYVVIALNQSSIPYQLKFRYYCTAYLTPSDVYWYVSESEDNSTWTEKWSSSSKSTSASAEQTVNLSKSTKYIKLCYSGNYAGTFKDIKVTDQAYVHNPKVGEEEITSLDFGSGTISSGKAELSFDVEWCNVSTLSVSSNNTNYFTVSPASFGNTAQYSTQTVTVYYDRDVAVGNNHSGTITISNNNANYTKTVTVTGTTTLRPQAIHWNASLAAVNYTLNAEDNLTGSAIATADNEEATITYTSSNTNIIAVSPDGKTLVAVNNGTATITATATGNDIYDVGTDSKTFTVTAKKKQTITWEQTLVGLKTNASPNKINLNATATSGGTVTYAIEAGSDACITLSGANNSVMTITGTPGEAYIIATQAGGIINGEEWISATARKQVKVRDPNSACDEDALVDESFTFSKGEKTSMSEKEFMFNGKPTTLSFKAKRGNLQYAWSTQKSLYIEQYANFGSGLEWKQIDAITPGTKEGNYGPYSLEPTATKIRFSSGEFAEQQVYSITSARKTIFDVSETSITDDAERNVKWSKTISVTRSNIDVMDISVSSDDSSCPFQLSKTSIGTDCADMNTETFEVFFTPTTKNKTYTGTITITDGKATNTHTATIPLSITTVAFNQAITWNFADNQEFETTHEPLVFDATTDATGLEVSYKIKEGDESLATLAGNTLTFTAAGTLHVIAYQEGNDRYNPAPEIEKTIIITPVTPDIATDPTVSEIKYLDYLTNGEGCQLSGGKATVTLRGVANTEVEGTFTWTNPQQITDAPGNHTYSVTFTPTDGGMYNPVTYDLENVEISLATTPTLTMNNTSIGVSRIVSEQEIVHKKTVNLTDLVKDLPTTHPMDEATFTYAFKSVDTSDAAFAGSAACESSAHINDTAKTFYATEVGVYTITVTSPATSYYAERSVDFTITVNKLKPTLYFSAEDTVYRVRPVQQAAICVCENETIVTPGVRYASANESAIVEQQIDSKDEYQLRGMQDDDTDQTAVTVTASYAGNAYFQAADDAQKAYVAIAKYTPRFFVDNSEETAERTLYVGQELTASFIYCNAYNDQSYPLTYAIGTSGVISYDPATRTITAENVGTTTLTFTQTQDGYRYFATRDFNFRVLKNTTELTLADQVKNASLYVGDVLSGTLYTANTEEVPVTITSDNEQVIVYENGELRAVGEGDATITFAMTPKNEKALKWEACSLTDTLHVSRRANTLSSNFTSITKSYGGSETFTITASNTDYENYPINLEAVTNSDLVTITRTAGNAFRVMAKHTEGTVTLRATQEISTEYVGATLNGLNFTIGKSNYHVPVSLNEALFNDSYFTTQKYAKMTLLGVTHGTNYYTMSGQSLVLGGEEGGGTDWDDKYVVLRFEGIPDKLTFQHKCTSKIKLGLGEVTQAEWYVQESTDGNFSDSKTWTSSLDNQSNYTNVSIDLQPSTRYVKLCYSGNYAGVFKDIHISERSELVAAEPATTAGAPYVFEAKPLGSDDSEQLFSMDWYNIDEVNVTSSDPHFSVAPSSFAGYEDYGQQPITVIYHRSMDIGLHTATITITNGTQTQHIYVKGETTKKTATITWHPDIEDCGFLMNPNEVYPSGAIDYVALLSNGGEYTLTSSNPSVISVEGNTLIAHAIGTSTIGVHYAGSGDFYQADKEQLFTVTDATKQTITWNQNLMTLRLGDASLTLDATASSGQPVTYTLESAGIVSVVGNTLSVSAAGDTYITATQAGGTFGGVTYASISKTKRVHVSDPNLQCTDYAISNQSCTFASLQKTAGKVFTLDGPGANRLYFSAYHDKASGTFWDNFEAVGAKTYNPLIIEEYRNNNNTWEWHEIFNQVVNKETAANYSAVVDPTTTKIRISSNEEVTHHVSNISLRRRKEVSASETSINASADCNVLYQKTIRIFHSGVDVLTTSVNGGFRLDKETLGEGCGTYSYEDLTVSITPSELTTYSSTIVITDGKTNETRLEIPISVTAQPISQTIVDFTAEATYLTTDDVQFSAHVLSGNTVYYTSSAEAIATVDADGHMHIITSGEVTITAHCDAQGFYNAAPDVSQTFTINKVMPQLSIAPTATEVTVPATLANSYIDASAAVMIDDKGTTITGSFDWEENTTATTVGTHDYIAIFTPENDAWYTTAEVPVSVKANARAKRIVWSLDDNTTAYCFLTMTMDAKPVDDETGAVLDQELTYTVDHPEIAYINEVGTLIVHNAGTITITASSPAVGIYDAAPEQQRTITLQKATPTLVVTPRATPISKKQTLSRSYFHSYKVQIPELDYDVPGSFAWDTPELVIEEPGTYTYPAHFNPTNTRYFNSIDLNVDLRVVTSFWTYVDTENHDYNDPNNWSNSGVPNGLQPDITVQGNVDIEQNITFSSLLIDEGGSVTVTNDAKVTIAYETMLSESGEYGDLIVEKGAEVELNTPMNVRNFILRSTPSNDYDMGTSGQITNAENLNIVNGDVYFELELSPYVGAVRANGEYWYGFSVPFPVDRSNGGIARYDLDEFGNGYWNDNLEFDEDYVLASYNSTRRASGLAGWRMYSNPVLYPGQFYMLVNRSTSGERYRFRMDQSLAWQTSESLPVATYFNPSNCDAEGVHNQGDDNWNALANPNLLYSNTDYNSVLFAQIYLNGRGVYKPVQLSKTKFVVGAPFFIQSVEAGTMIMRPIDDAVSAPQRNTGWHSDIYKLTFAAEQQSLYADQIFLSASEEALDSYEFGKDLEKFEATVNEPQVWVMAYNRHLCANNAVLENGTAIYSLALRAPQTASYVIDLVNPSEETVIYLTYQGNVIWNLSQGAYTFDLVKGLNKQYGIMLVDNRQNISTDVEETNQTDNHSKVEKVIINNRLYIIKDGVMYDATGVKQ